jgi:hypothetical protein
MNTHMSQINTATKVRISAGFVGASVAYSMQLSSLALWHDVVSI